MRPSLSCTLPVLLVLSALGALASDEPTIAKDFVQLEARSAHFAVGWGWKPRISFRVNGPIASGSQLYVQYGLPTKKVWVRVDCATQKIPAGKWYGVQNCDVSDRDGTAYAGPVDFSIHLRNELQGTDLALFTGKAKVVKELTKGDPIWYVDDDWRIPIGYVFLAGTQYGGAKFLHVGFVIRGNTATVQAHLFYNGNEIDDDSQVGNDEPDWRPNDHAWALYDFSFSNVRPASDGDSSHFSLKDNPGEYELKALIVGHLARSIKFTVGPDGGFDNGIATANQLGSDRVIVPVKVLGNQFKWDTMAWKTGAFYGNPLAGFTADTNASAAAH